MTLITKKHFICGAVLFYITLFFALPKFAQATDWRSPEIKYYSSNPVNELDSFYGFSDDFTGGMSVASCDLDGNGYEEIVIGAGIGGGPQVRILNSLGKPIFTPGFFAFDEKIKAGWNIAIGDIDGGGLKEIVVAPAYNHEPEVRVFNRFGAQLNFDIYPFHPDFSGGISIATANVDGGAEDELVLGVQSQDISLIKVIKPGFNIAPLGEFVAFPEDFKGGVNLTSGDIDQDGFDEIIVAANSGGGPHVKAFEAYGKELNLNIFPYESEFRGGVQVSSGDINNDGYDEIITSPSKKIFNGTVTKIIVDLSEQRLWAYESNYLLKTFLVSTGLPGTPTLPGNFRISQKIYSKLYSGANYYLPNTLWNMRFDGSRLLHGAYWHNNFGHRMSHGCVNISYPDAEWLYDNTPIWTPVIVKD